MDELFKKKSQGVVASWFEGGCWVCRNIDARGEKFIAVGFEQDPDFPEIFVVFTDDREPVKLNRKSPGVDIPSLKKFGADYYDMIDQPLGAVVWADDGNDIVWKDGDNEYYWRFKINDDAWAIVGVVNEYTPTEGERERLESTTLYP